MRIAFIIPDKEMRWDSVHQGVGYVAAYVKANMIIDKLSVFRTSDKSSDELDTFINQGWDVVGITITTPMVVEAKVICEKVIKMTSAIIVVGGAEVTTIKEGIFAQLPLIDFAIAGEGEITFFELTKALSTGASYVGIPGLIYKSHDDAIHKNERRAFEDNLALFPYPDRTLFKYDYDFHSIIGTRGCPFHCTFCNSSSNWRHRYRIRPPIEVYREVKYIVDLYGKDKFFAFNDDAFNINKKWVVEVCNLLKQLDIRFWVRGLRAGIVTKEVATALVGSGCFGVACGVESADNDALRSMRKATTIEEILKGVKILKSCGMRNITGQFIIGNHGDTLETLKKSIAYAKYFTEPTFGIAYAIPNTYLFKYVQENNYFLEEKVPIKYKGRIIDWVTFDTPHFSLVDRLAAVELAIKAKVYHGIDYDDE